MALRETLVLLFIKGLLKIKPYIDGEIAYRVTTVHSIVEVSGLLTRYVPFRQSVKKKKLNNLWEVTFRVASLKCLVC